MNWIKFNWVLNFLKIKIQWFAYSYQLEPLFHFTSPPLETHGNSLQRRAVTMENIFPPTSPTQQRFRTDEKTLFVLSGVSRGEGSGVHEKFNSSTNSWDLWMQKDLGVAFQAVMVHEVLVVLGGMKDDVIHSNVWIYNFSTHKWSIGPKMITSRLENENWLFKDSFERWKTCKNYFQECCDKTRYHTLHSRFLSAIMSLPKGPETQKKSTWINVTVINEKKMLGSAFFPIMNFHESVNSICVSFRCNILFQIIFENSFKFDTNK